MRVNVYVPVCIILCIMKCICVVHGLFINVIYIDFKRLVHGPPKKVTDSRTYFDVRCFNVVAVSENTHTHTHTTYKFIGGY